MHHHGSMKKTDLWGAEKATALGKRITVAREARGLTMARVAEGLGFSKASVGHWEAGNRALKVSELAALCDLLKVSAGELLFGIKRWPFERIEFDSVSDLDQRDTDRLEGALILAAAQLGVDIKHQAA